LVTTSAVNRQAYEEIREDGHPVIIICGRDIAKILIDKGFNSLSIILAWLNTEFPND
jgi:hypothetical protein